MRFGFKKAAAVILMSIIFAGATAQAYNLAPQSFQNFYNTASAGNLQGLQSMIYRGLSLESTNQNGDTAICVAIRSQDAIAYRTLKQAGADIEPSCLKKISDEQKDAFFEQNDPEYAVQRSKSQWSKTGTAVLIGGGVAAGVIALAASGGGSGGGHSDDSTPIAPTCEDNPCGEGCFNNLTCPAGQVCSSSNTCGGCESCAVKSECTSVANKCNAGCYTNLVCQAGYECAAKNECGGCESCTKKSICATNKCASGCYTDIGCGENKACTARNSCGGCTRCNYVNHPNANHCADFDTKNNICLRCRSGYTAVDGVCRSDKPSHCVKYDYTTKICSMCDAGYSLSSDQKSCIRDIDTNCTSASFPLTTPPTNANISSCYDGTTTRYKITSCKIGYDLSADGKSCVPNGSGGDTGTCNAANYPLTTKPNDTSANYTFCIDGTTTRYKITSCKTGYTLSSDKKSCDAIPAGTCTAANYPLTAKPANATSESCTDGSTTRYKITSCNTGYNLSADGKSCEAAPTGTCTAANYPLTAKPANATFESCTDGSTTRYKITSCNKGYNLSSDGKSCIENSESETCDETIYPFTECPKGAVCGSCHIGLGYDYRYNLSYCKVGYTLSEDGNSCLSQCDRTSFNLSACPDGAVCSTCEDASGTYYKFDRCRENLTEDANGNCTVASIEATDNDVANDKELAVTPDNVAVNDSYIIGFSNAPDHLNANLYNAKTEDASISITITESTDLQSLKNKDIFGLATNGSDSGNVINSYDKHTGTITIDNYYANYNTYGMRVANGIAYNTYNGYGKINLTSNGIYFLDDTDIEYNNGIIAGMYGSTAKSTLYNAFSGIGEITVSTKAGKAYGMLGSTLINAYSGSIGNITVSSEKGYIAGMRNKSSTTGFIANAYSTITDGSAISHGTITINNPNNITAYGIYNSNALSSTIYNAYGHNAVGKIIINGSGIGITSTGIVYNGANTGYGYIEINSTSTDPIGQIIGIQYDDPLNPSYNGHSNGTGEIKITVAGQSQDSSTGNIYYHTVYGLDGSINNGSLNGGKGIISITDTGNNNVTGIYGGGNFANSSVTINSNGDTSKTVIGMSNVRLKSETQNEDYATPEATDEANQNYGTIDVTTTNGAATYGIYAKNTNVLNDKNGKITINSAGVAAHGIYSNKSIYNNGSITVRQGSFSGNYKQSGIYLENNTNTAVNETVYNTGNMTLNVYSPINKDLNSPIPAQGYGIYSDGHVKNSGYIYIYGGEYYSSLYGIYSTLPYQNENTGRITLKGGIDNTGLVNVNNGIGGYIDLAPTGPSWSSHASGITAFRPNGYEDTITLVNGSVSSPATSVSDSQHGYIKITGSGENREMAIEDLANGSPSLAGIMGIENSDIYNYGTIILSGNSIAGIENKYSGKIYNYGYIDINVSSYNAAGIYSGSDVEVYNENAITLTTSSNTSANRRWYGMYGGLITNNGTVTLNIHDGSYATGMSAGFNNGDIILNVTSNTTSYGIRGSAINNRNIQINASGYFAYGMSVTKSTSDTSDISAINNKNGSIEINNIATGAGIEANNGAKAINKGNIAISDSFANSTNNIKGIQISSGSTAVNEGSILLNNINGENNVYGIYSDNSNVVNTGNITLTNVNKDTSYGIYAINGSKVYNSGTITINGESYNKNEADGKFIYIDSSSSIINESEITASSAFDTAALGGGKFVLGKDGKITAPEIKGDITADAGITSGGFDKTYSNKNAFSGKTDEVKLNSGSALFDAALKNNDIVMTMKDFDEVVDDKSLAAYLQRNYEAKRNEQLFNSLKLQTTSARLNSSLNQQLGFSLLPNFAQENMNVFRSLSNLVTDTMFSQDLTNERMMVGYDYLGQDRSSKGRVTGYENTANSSYFLADTKLNNRQRFGLGVALTRFSSDYDDDSTRKATFAQTLGSYMHDFGNRWKYAGLLRVGYADGDYKRQSDSERVSGDTSDILYGFNNELRYNYDLGFMTLEPQVELNAYGYYQRKIKENDEKISALLVDGTNNLSIEAGAGLYAGKETVYGETGRVKARLGGSYYRELSQPYHTMRARVRDTDGYYLIESTDIFDRNRVIVRADITFSWKAFDFYLRGSQFMEDKHTTVINAGIKFNF